MNNDLPSKIEHIKALNGMPEVEWRFWAKVDTSGDCWEWQAAKNFAGYGVFALDGKNIPAHRCSWLFTYGEILSSDTVLMHQCDNPGCVNPLHLKPGTHFENSIDMARKGRGSDNMRPKLTKKLADKAREEYTRGGITQADLAKKYGVSCRTMQKLLSMEIWKDHSIREMRGYFT